jgi:hypothetical protein
LNDIARETSQTGDILWAVACTDAAAILIEIPIDHVVTAMVSRPRELPPQPLAERYVNLSIHTAPIKQTDQPFPAASGQINGDTASLSLPGIAMLVSYVSAVT